MFNMSCKEPFSARGRSHQICFEPFILYKHMFYTYEVVTVRLSGVIGILSQDGKSYFEVKF